MKFYRYEAVQYASMDMDGEYYSPSTPNPKLEVREFDLVSETPNGWINWWEAEWNTVKNKKSARQLVKKIIKNTLNCNI